MTPICFGQFSITSKECVAKVFLGFYVVKFYNLGFQQATNAPAYEDTYDLKDPICKLSTAYRVLADHSRMITACLADGMFPDQK